MPISVWTVTHWIVDHDLLIATVVGIVVVCYCITNLGYSGWLTVTVEKQLAQHHYHGLPDICRKLDPFMFLKSTDVLKEHGLLQEIDLSGQGEDEA